MGDLQKAMEKGFADLPRIAALQLARRKLDLLGIDSDEMVEKLADAILATDDKPNWSNDIVINFDDSDLEELNIDIDNLVEKIPDIVVNLSVKLAEEKVVDIREQWETSRPVEEPRDQARTRVIKDWGKANDALRMLVVLCEQEGHKFNIRQLETKRRNSRDATLARLHIRGCRIANEILLLLEHGHNEGAQARWRTLHEVAIAATLIKKGGVSLAERYLDHEAIERKSSLDDFRRATEARGGGQLRIVDAIEIETEFERMIEKHGSAFKGMYGWASGQLGLPKQPKFFHLLETAGSLSLKHRFRVASSDNHASVATLGQPVHQWDLTETIPGVFAPGFEGPGVDTVQAIVQLTIALYHEPWDLDCLVLGHVLVQLRDDTAALWLRTARQIEKRKQRAIVRATQRGRGKRLGYIKAKPVNRS